MCISTKYRAKVQKKSDIRKKKRVFERNIENLCPFNGGEMYVLGRSEGTLMCLIEVLNN